VRIFIFRAPATNAPGNDFPLLSSLAGVGCTQISFYSTPLVLKKTSDGSIVSAKTKSKPKTFQKQENAMLSEIDSFDKILMAL